jgi:hypothetical protein
MKEFLITMGVVAGYGIIGAWVYLTLEGLYDDPDHPMPMYSEGEARFPAGVFWPLIGLPFIIAAKAHIKRHKAIRIRKEEDELLRREGLK